MARESVPPFEHMLGRVPKESIAKTKKDCQQPQGRVQSWNGINHSSSEIIF